ncbi:MAG: ABC transporter ATP-binding protein [Armatimonadetes bacterium]|nr:ABC transporter ATP-binding protein [Armatimonadota bacterium]
MTLRLEDVTYSYGSRQALRGIALRLESGEFAALIGPNGSGKSTLLRICAGVLAPRSGKVELEGTGLASMPRKSLASRIAFVPQSTALVFPYTCWEVVMMGRYPYFRGLGLQEREHAEIVERCMAETGVLELRNRRVTELSGGEAQRVHIARALAQEADHLLLDEPTSHLDVRFGLEVMELLFRLHRERGLSILVSLHDLNLASLYCGRLFVLRGGLLYGQGTPEQAITRAALADVFGVEARILEGPERRPRVELWPRRFVDAS